MHEPRWLLLSLLAACSAPAQGSLGTTSSPLSAAQSAQPVGEQAAATVASTQATPDVPSGAAAKRDVELGEKAAAYFDAFVNHTPTLTRDAKRVVFVSNRDGLPQLYVADATRPAGSTTRLVTTAERVSDVFMLQDGKSVLFRSDVGANEQWSVYRVGLDGGSLIELTPGEPLNRDSVIVPDGLPETMFFSARKMSEPKSTLYSVSVTTPGAAKAIYTDELPAFLEDVSVDGKAALMIQYPARTENHLLRVDIASGKAEKLYPTEGHVSIHAAAFSPDGRVAYLATDAGGEQQLLLALDAKTGNVVAKHEIKPATAQVSGVLVAKKGGLLAVNLIVGSGSEVRLFDGESLTERRTVGMPLGQGNAVDFSLNGQLLTAQWSTPSAPTNAFVIDTASGKVDPLRTEERPTLRDMPEIASSVVEIPAFDGGKIPANVYVRKGEENKPHPTIVVYHGGPSGVSMIRWAPTTAFFVSLGYAVVEPNVRGSSGYGRAYEAGDNGPKRLDAFKDIEFSARWVAKQPFADPDRLVVFGGSYGGYTTLIALSRWPDIWRAGVNLFGVVNLKTFMETTSGLIRKIFLVEFGDPEKDASFLARISPITDVDKIVDPTFVYAGANDPRVPRSESDLIVKALRQRSIPSEYYVANNEGHSVARRETHIALFGRVARFLETHMR